jgi:hypothetical protein
MPLWMQIAGAIASALLSYYTKYDDSHVQDLIKDVAYDLNLALQRLSEISFKIDALAAELHQLPEAIRTLLREQELSEHNTAVQASLLRYKQLIGTGRNDALFREQLQDIYNGLVTTTTQLEVLTKGCDIRMAPLASLLTPLALMLELALLYRMGTSARALRRQTLQRYQEWFDWMLEPGAPNGLAAAVADSNAKLQASEDRLNAGPLAPALTQIGTLQAIYCLEHQIGDTLWRGFPAGTMATVYKATWIRIYGLVAVDARQGPGIVVREIKGSGAVTEDVYARLCYTDNWYGPRPVWGTPVDVYDSQDMKRFQGEDSPSRIRDIKNSPKWRNFIVGTMPSLMAALEENNSDRLYARAAVTAARHAVALSSGGHIALDDSATA